MTTLQNKKSKIKSDKKEHQISENETFLKSQIIEANEEILSSSEAIHFHEYLTNPSKDPKVEKMIRNALNMFPDPDKPSKFRIKL
ncbi:MAG TPA: hypothetical protein VMV49_07075 [Candidatus Deferrimicrobium sp.]|nr:hypothetical protein [Candidatus Deferrimicrobium sp.]